MPRDGLPQAKDAAPRALFHVLTISVADLSLLEAKPDRPQGSRCDQLNLFDKAAAAHDEISNPALAAKFTALSTRGVEWRLSNGVSLTVKADSEWGDRSHTYSGTGRTRYVVTSQPAAASA